MDDKDLLSITTWTMHWQCRNCGYDLYGSVRPQCPECGTIYTEARRVNRRKRMSALDRGNLALVFLAPIFIAMATFLISLGAFMPTGDDYKRGKQSIADVKAAAWRNSAALSLTTGLIAGVGTLWWFIRHK
jgi:hypothetical protein